MVGCRITGSGTGLFLNRVCASEAILMSVCKVCFFFSDFMAVVCEDVPFFGFVVGIVCVSFFLLCVSFQSCYEVGREIVFHYGEDLLPFGLFSICCEG